MEVTIIGEKSIFRRPIAYVSIYRYRFRYIDASLVSTGAFDMPAVNPSNRDSDITKPSDVVERVVKRVRALDQVGQVGGRSLHSA